MEPESGQDDLFQISNATVPRQRYSNALHDAEQWLLNKSISFGNPNHF